MVDPAPNLVPATSPAGSSVRAAGTSVRCQPDDLEALVERLVEEMGVGWQEGRRPLAEEFLARHPEIGASAELTVRLVYEEFCLRQEADPDASPTEVLHRFPHLRDELELLLDCHQLIKVTAPPPRFPEAGEVLGDFTLVAELGRGSRGRVFLATQPSLANRPLVLKLTPQDDEEHLALARLQHTHIVPLYWREEFPSLRLRALCMPYLGATTLGDVLRALRGQPPARRSGRDLLEALDRAQKQVPLALPRQGAARAHLGRASHARAVCWIGACLAEALQYAHERGLVHLDLKPSNILLGADGTPLLLDFHLAREPVAAGQPAPAWLGGTPEYMPPEQRLALDAVRDRRPVPEAVDARSDIYSLGVVLYEAMAGKVPPADGPPPRLEQDNPQVSRGLADIIHRCLAPDPRQRYQDAAALAADLRRHLDDLPLRGVANRSLAERWRKWRRRRPYDLPLVGLLLGLLAAVFAGGALTLAREAERHREVEGLFVEGQEHLGKHRYDDAARSLERGLELAGGLTGDRPLKQALARHLRLAHRAGAAQKLHRQAELARLFDEFDPSDRALRYVLEAGCREAWGTRQLLTDRSGEALETEAEQNIRADLIETAVLLGDLGVRRAAGSEAGAARRAALGLLDEAEALCGPSPVLEQARQVHAEALGLEDLARQARRRAADVPPRTPWEHCALARLLLQSGDLARAAAEADQACRLQPEGFWPNFYGGACAYRGRHYEDAVRAFSACVWAAPFAPQCLHRRAQAYAALGETDNALRDLDRALQLKPDWKEARALRDTLRQAP